MADAEKVRLWEDRVRRWRSSGLTAEAFATREGIGVSSLGLWSRKLAAQKKELATFALARVDVGKPPRKDASRAVLQLELRSGVTIRIDEDTDLDFVALVLGALGRAT